MTRVQTKGLPPRLIAALVLLPWILCALAVEAAPSRQHAKDLIAKAVNGTMVVEEIVVGPTNFNGPAPYYDRLDSEGFTSRVRTGNNMEWRVDLQTKAEPYVVRRESQCKGWSKPHTGCAIVRLWTLELDDVTGIHKSANCESVAEFSVKIKKTPIARVVMGQNLPNDKETGQACFAKFDDGWRMTDFHFRPGIACKGGAKSCFIAGLNTQ